VRIGFLFGGLVLHAAAMQTFYLDFMNGRANPVDAFLGTISVRGREGGPLGFLVWAVPQIAGSLVYDLVAQQSPERAWRRLFNTGIALVGIGYSLSSLSSFYPVAQGPRPVAYVYPETDQSTPSPVLPPFSDGSARDVSAYFNDPPFFPPPPERQRIWNYWMLSRRLATPTMMLTTTGFGLMMYALCVVLCDAGAFRLGVLRTFGQNPLIAYLLDGWVGGLIHEFWPEEGGWRLALAGSALRFSLTYVPVRLLEWRRIYLRL
jgi:hypothetical protein